MQHPCSKLALATSIVLASVAGSAVAQTTTRVSVDSQGAQSNDYSWNPAISADGRYVVFESGANNLVPGDTNVESDVFVHDCLTAATVRVSVSASGAQGDSWSGMPSISSDGRYVVFWSRSTNLIVGDTNGRMDAFLCDTQTTAVERVSVATGGIQATPYNYGPPPAVTPDGRFVVFWSDAPDLVTGDTNGAGDIFVRDRQAGTTERVSVDSSGGQANDASDHPSISSDARYVAFSSIATNLVPGDTNGVSDIFVHDRQTGVTERLSVGPNGAQGDRESYWPSISSDGRFLCFGSLADNLVPGDTNGTWDVYVRDRQSGSTQLVSVDSSGIQGNSASAWPSISSDGRYVAFRSYASNLVPGDTNGLDDVFVRDLVTGSTARASVSTAGAEGDHVSYSYPFAVSVTGRVAFWSEATTLVSGDTNGASDIFLFDPACTGSISTYCTAKTNSLGCVPSIGSLGIPSQSGPDNFYVTAANVQNRKLGMLIWSLTPDSQPFFGGTLCLHAPIKRTPGQNSGGSATGNDCTGTYSFHFSQAYMLQQLLGADTTVYCQFWSRDPGFAPPNNVGLTNGLQFTICP